MDNYLVVSYSEGTNKYFGPVKPNNIESSNTSKYITSVSFSEDAVLTFNFSDGSDKKFREDSTSDNNNDNNIVEPDNPIDKLLVDIMMPYNSNDFLYGFYEELFNGFQDKQNFKVNSCDYKGEIHEFSNYVLDEFNKGNEPDVIYLLNKEIKEQLINNNKIVSINEIKSVYPKYGSNIKSVLLGTHSIPTASFIEVLFANKNHLTSEIAKTYLNNNSNSWDDFILLLEDLVKTNKHIEGYKPIAYGKDIPHYWIDNLVMSSLGLNALDASAEELHQALIKLNDLKPYLSYNASNEDAVEGFLSGKYTFNLDGSWFRDLATERLGENNIEVLPLPIINKELGVVTIAGFLDGFYITKKAWNDPVRRENAVKLVEYITSTNSLSKLISVNGSIPADLMAKSDYSNIVFEKLTNIINFIDRQTLPFGDYVKYQNYGLLVNNQHLFVDNNSSALEILKEFIKNR